ncbi:TPA: hypothetical protein ACH3X3_004911 [Trebouxia sp. C0006]
MNNPKLGNRWQDFEQQDQQPASSDVSALGPEGTATTDVQDFSENGYEVAGLEQPIDISDDDDEAVADQFVIQDM